MINDKMINDIESIKTRLQFYKDSNTKAHVLFKNIRGTTYYNGEILEIGNIVFYINDIKFGRREIFFNDILNLDSYRGQ